MKRGFLLICLSLAPAAAFAGGDNLWNGAGTSETGNPNTGATLYNWDNVTNYTGTGAFGTANTLDFSSISYTGTGGLTLSATTGGTILASGVTFGVGATPIATTEVININGNGTIGGTTIGVNGSGFILPSTNGSIVTFGSDVNITLSGTDKLNFNNNPNVTHADTTVPVLVINGALNGTGGIFGSNASTYGPTAAAQTAFVLTDNNSALTNGSTTTDEILIGNVSYTSIANAGTASSLGEGIAAATNDLSFLTSGSALNFVGSITSTTSQSSSRDITLSGTYNILGNYSTTPGGTLTFAPATLTNTGNTALDFAVSSGNTISFGTALSGTAAINKVGSEAYYSANGTFTSGDGLGTTILTATNTTTGTTTISAGTLQVGNGTSGSLAAGTSTTGALTFNGIGGTFNVDEASGASQTMGKLTFSSGDGTVESTSNGGTIALTFSSLGARAAGATENFVINGGTNGTTNKIVLTGVTGGFINQGAFFDGGTASAGYAMMSGSGGYVEGIAYLPNTGTTTASSVTTSTGTFGAATLYGQISGSGAITAQGTQTLSTVQITNGNNFTIQGGSTLTVNGIMKSGNTAGGAISGGTGIQAASNTEMVIRVDQAGDSLTINTPILANGTNALTLSGAGTLTLGGANTYTGTTTINGGTLKISAANNLGAGTVLTMNGGTLDVNAGAGNTVTLGQTTFNVNGPSTIQSDSGTFATNDNLALGANTLTVAGAGNVGLGGILSSAGGGLTDTGTGTLTLSGNNTYVGVTTVTSGTLSVGTVQNSPGTSSNLGLATSAVVLGGASTSGLISYTGTGGIADTYTRGLIINAGGGEWDTTQSGVTLIFSGAGVNDASGGNFTVGGAGTTTINGVIGGGTGGVIQNGPGTLVLSGANTYTGGTAVNTGTLIASSASALSSGNVTVASGAGLEYQAGTDTQLNIGGSLSITGGAGTTIGGSLGATTTSSEINVSGIASISNAPIKVSIYGENGITPTTGTYTLVTAAAGSSLSGGSSYSLGPVYNDTNFTVGSLSETGTAIQVGITSSAGLTNAYWTGGYTGGSNVWAASDGSTTSNWSTTNGSVTNTGLVPGASTSVYISDTGFVSTAPTSTVLGANMTINSLTIQDTVNGLGLNADGNTLTIAPSSSSTGITVNSGVPASYINANIALGANQTWTNNSANTFTVGGVVSGTNSLTTAGTGTIVLTGANTNSGGTNVNAGTLTLIGLGTLGANTNSLSVNNVGTVLNLNTSAPTIVGSLSGTGATTINNGGQNFTVNQTTAGTYAGVIAGTGSFTLGSLTTSTLTLTGVNTYTGSTTVNAGTLTISGAGTLGASTNSLYVNNNNTVVNLSTTAPTTIGSLGGSGFATINNGGQLLTVNESGGNQTYAGYLVGTGGFALGASSVTLLTFTNTNSYSGGTTINAGALETFGNGTLGTGSVTINGGTLAVANSLTTGSLSGTGGTIGISTGDVYTVNETSAGTYSGAITGLGGLTLGSGTTSTLTLSGANTYTGGTTVNAGTLTVSGSGTLGGTTSALTVNNAGSVVNLSTATTTGSLSGKGASTINNGGQLFTVNQTAVGNYAGTIAGTGGFALGSGSTTTLRLSGSNTYTGGTTVNAGTLIANSSTALNGTSSVTVAAGAGFGYQATSNAQLNINGTMNVTGGTGTTIYGSVGSTTTGSEIKVTGIASISNAPITVNVYGENGSTPTGTYTLVSGAAGSTLNGGSIYTLGTIYNDTNFTVGALSETATAINVGITSATGLTTAYWKGGLTGSTNVWAASTGTTSNWTTTAGGAVQALVPGSTTAVIISATSPTTPPGNTGSTVLGANMTINTLAIQDTTNGLILNADGNTLTIAPTTATTGINISASVPASTINANVALGANQTWTNNSANAFTVGGVISGSSTLTTAGNGTIVLSGANTYTSGTTVNAGTLTVTGTLGATTNTLAVNAGTLNLNTSTTTGSLSGTGGTINVASGDVFTANQTTSGTYAGKIASAGGFTLGSGSTAALTLTGTNTYTGATTVNGGTLIVGNASTGSINNTSAINVSGGSLLFNLAATNTATKVTMNGTSPAPGVLGYTGTAAAGTTVSLGALSLVASSVTAIDFGSSNVSTIIFNQGTAAIGLAGTTVLNVYHYVAGDILEFSGSATPNAADNFGQVQFFSGAIGSSTSIGFGQEVAFGGGFQVVPAATPEPSTIIVGICFLGLVLRYRMSLRSQKDRGLLRPA